MTNQSYDTWHIEMFIIVITIIIIIIIIVCEVTVVISFKTIVSKFTSCAFYVYILSKFRYFNCSCYY